MTLDVSVAATQGTVDAQFVLGSMVEKTRRRPDAKKDELEARRLMRLAAEQEYADAPRHPGDMLENGIGGPQNEVEGRRLYALAAEQGRADAQNNLGYMLAGGIGGPKDEVEGRRLLTVAAEQGYADAQSNLGHMLWKGLGGPKDEVEGRRWFRLAAEQGLAVAQCNLGGMLTLGIGGPKDEVEGRQWFRLAAEQGYAVAQCNLGGILWKGLVVPKVKVEARRLCAARARQLAAEDDLAMEDEQEKRANAAAEALLAEEEREKAKQTKLANKKKEKKKKKKKNHLTIADSPSATTDEDSTLGEAGSPDSQYQVAQLAASLQASLVAENDEQECSISRCDRLPELSSTPIPLLTAQTLAQAGLDPCVAPPPADSSIGGNSTCTLCFKGDKDQLAVPCGHLCACADCVKLLAGKLCPICCSTVSFWQRVHIV